MHALRVCMCTSSTTTFPEGDDLADPCLKALRRLSLENPNGMKQLRCHGHRLVWYPGRTERIPKPQDHVSLTIRIFPPLTLLKRLTIAIPTSRQSRKSKAKPGLVTGPLRP